MAHWGSGARCGTCSPETTEGRCWFHKTANVLAALPKSAHPGAKKALAEIWGAEDKQHARAAVKAFPAAYAAKFPKAVAKITDDLEQLLAFYDYPAEHWVHLRTTNPIESAFASVRHRTKITRGPGSRAAGLAMAFKLIEAAQDRWRAVNAPHLVAQLHRSGKRIGQYGRARPVDSNKSRQQLIELLADRTDASVREIAAETGVSPSTVSSVRRKLATMAATNELGGEEEAGTAKKETRRAGPHVAAQPTPNQHSAGAYQQSADTTQMLHNDSHPTAASLELLKRLGRDPAVRGKEAGRDLVRWLSVHVVKPDNPLPDLGILPQHARATVRTLALQVVAVWTDLAHRLNDLGRRPNSSRIAALRDPRATAFVRMRNSPR